MRFDHEWRVDGPPYTGRHRKSWLTARGGWRRVYLPRVRPEPDPDPPAVAQQAHRGRPAMYSDHGSRGR